MYTGGSRHNKFYKINHLSCWVPGLKCKVIILSLILIIVLGILFACKDNSTANSSSTPFFPVQKAGIDRMAALLEGRLEL